MSYELRSYSGKAQASTLQANIGSGDSFFTIGSGDASTWVDINNSILGVAGSFVCVIGYGGTNEEKVLCSGITSSTQINIASGGRGYDGTTASTHSAGEIVMPVFSANEAYEANLAVNKTIGKITAVGDMLYGDATNSLARLPIGSAISILTAAGGVPTWNTPTSGASAALENTTTGLQWVSTVPPSILAYQAANAASALTVNTFTKVALDTITTPGFTAGASGLQPTLTTSGANKGRVTINKSGVYQINASVSTGLGSLVHTDFAQAAFQVSLSGTTSRFAGPRNRAIAGFFADADISNTFAFSANDWVELNISCNQASTVQGSNSPYCTFMSVTYIGPLS